MKGTLDEGRGKNEGTMSKPVTDENRGLPQVAVIGAGFAGLTAARALADQGHRVVVFDKGREPGGRASTRRREGFAWDHGAQYFTARDERFRLHVEQWLESGVIARWEPRLVVFDADGVRAPRSAHERFVGVPGMNEVAKHLAKDLDVLNQVKVSLIERSEEEWWIEDEAGETVAAADFAVVAVPPAQAIPLLATAPRLAELAAAAKMRPCWAVLLGFENSLSVEFDGAFVNVGPLGWVARNASKPERGHGEAWVLHGSMAWSEQNLEREASEVIELLREEFRTRCVGSELPTIRHAEAHRWLYAQPDPALDRSYLFDEELRIGVAGDWCGESRIEGAVLSGLALASRILNQDGGKQ
jgi:predicted NAD/FAD-dependent oxidoreductase